MYEVFIAFKNDSNEDFKIAKALYEELSSRGRGVFFYPVSLRNLGESDWEKGRDVAAEEANMLVVVGTSVENITSPQVEHEWNTLFYAEKLNSRKPFAEIYSCTKGVDITELPPILRNNSTNFDLDKYNIAYICSWLENKLGQRNTYDNRDNEKFGGASYIKTGYKYRFKYNSGYTKLIGRDSDISFLEKFCNEENTPVTWTVIHGKGGVGKSKLAFEFCRLMKSKGWNVFAPSHAKSFEKSYSSELVNVNCDTIVCFDYAKYELDVIEGIIKLATTSPKLSGNRVRFILLEREEKDLIDGFSARIGEYHYKFGNLELGRIDDESIISITEDYIKSVGCKRQINDEDKENIIVTLDKVDPDNHRPLFALFIADAWIDDPKKLRNWDEEAAVKYVANKEQERIEKVAYNYANTRSLGNQNSNFLKCAVLMATFCDSLDFKTLADTCCRWFDVNESIALELLRNCDFASEDTLIGIEPDIIGEYVCMQVLNSLEESIIDRLFNELFENYFFDTIAFIDKMFDDYRNLFISAGWSCHCTEIEIPWNIKYIKNNMFRGFSFVKKIKLHEQISLICKGAFRDCDNLEEINFPHNLEIIESAAFMGCTSLESAMPDDEKGWMPSIIRIEDRAFRNCYKLKYFKMPRSLKDIGDAAFQNCSELEMIEIPKDVTTIPYNAFGNCTSLKKVFIRDKDRDRKCVKIQSEAFSGCSNLERINLKIVSYIGKSAFENCENLLTIHMGQKCLCVGESAFNGCRMLEAADLSHSQITVLGDKCFRNCEKLKKVYLPKTIKVIGEQCFYNCTSLEIIIFPKTLRKIKCAAFLGCNQLNVDSFGSNFNTPIELSGFTVTEINEKTIRFITSYFEKTQINLPKEIISIGDKAFYGDENLISINIHCHVKKIGKDAFRFCNNMEVITGTFSGINIIEEGAFDSCKKLKRIPSDGIINCISDSVFKNCNELEEVGFNSRLTKIGRDAFYNCNSLRRLSYKGKCKQISTRALQNCPNFFMSKRIHIERQKEGYYISGFIFKTFGQKEQLFLKNYSQWENVRIPSSCIGFFENPFENNKTIRTISIPNSVRFFINYNFSSIPMLETIELPAGIKALKRGFFKDCKSLHRIKIGNDKPNSIRENITIGVGAFENCSSLNQITLEGNKDIIQARTFMNCVRLSDICLPGDIRVIGNNAFAGCENLKEVVLPNTVKEFGKGVFKGCSSLRRIEGFNECEITDIDNELFDGCKSLSEIELPSNLTSISHCAFRDCYVLSDIDLFNTKLEFIGIAAFQNCYMLQKVVIPVGVKKIEKHAFKSCTQLTTIKLPPEIETIGTSAFYGCNMLSDVDLLNKKHLVSLGNDSFANCHRIQQMTIPETVTELPRGLFRGCVSLEQVILEGPIKTIPADCFKDCQRLTKVIASEEITTIQVGAFRNCFELKDAHQFENVNLCEAAAFRGCISLEKIKLSKINTIPTALFMGCVKLRKVYFPQVEQIGNYAFSECRDLEEVPIQHAENSIGEGAFWGCYILKNVFFSSSIKKIHPSAFRNCKSIKEISFPRGMEEICATSFRNATALIKVTIPETIGIIRRSAFRDCINLTEVDIKSEHIVLETTAFLGCKNLYYMTFPGIVTAQITAFDETPCKNHLQKSNKIEWINNSFIYFAENEDIYLKKYIGEDTLVEVPEYIDGLPVRHVYDRCFEDNNRVIEILLPNSIVSIGMNAFAGCKTLQRIELGENIQFIGRFAFKFCRLLENIVIPCGVEVIEEGTFMCCYNLTNVFLHSRIRTIRSAAFWRCEALSADIPSSVEVIETGSFKGCDKTKIHLNREFDERFFEEWPFGEEVTSEKYGVGQIISCKYVEKNYFEIDIKYQNDVVETIAYPSGFGVSIEFANPNNTNKHNEKNLQLHEMSEQ